MQKESFRACEDPESETAEDMSREETTDNVDRRASCELRGDENTMMSWRNKIVFSGRKKWMACRVLNESSQTTGCREKVKQEKLVEGERKSGERRMIGAELHKAVDEMGVRGGGREKRALQLMFLVLDTRIPGQMKESGWGLELAQFLEIIPYHLCVWPWCQLGQLSRPSTWTTDGLSDGCSIVAGMTV